MNDKLQFIKSKCVEDGVMAICPINKCDEMLLVEYENNGFEPPDPPHYDAYYKCPAHGVVEPIN